LRDAVVQAIAGGTGHQPGVRRRTVPGLPDGNPDLSLTRKLHAGAHDSDDTYRMPEECLRPENIRTAAECTLPQCMAENDWSRAVVAAARIHFIVSAQRAADDRRESEHAEEPRVHSRDLHAVLASRRFEAADESGVGHGCELRRRL